MEGGFLAGQLGTRLSDPFSLAHLQQTIPDEPRSGFEPGPSSEDLSAARRIGFEVS